MYHKKFDKEILLKIKELYRYDNWHAVLAILYDYLRTCIHKNDKISL